MSAAKSKKKTSRALAAANKKLADAERAVSEAKNERRTAFREALVELFNEYGFALVPAGMDGTEIEELRSPYNIRDIPE